jgi:hypothetical protein
MKEYFASFQKRKIDSCSPKHEPDIAHRWRYHCDACYESSALFPILTIFNEEFHRKSYLPEEDEQRKRKRLCIMLKTFFV